MPNGYFNNQVRTGLSGGKAANPGGPSGKAPKFVEKPGFSTGVPGKTQAKDRSGGVKKLKVRPAGEGL